ncbi:MAG: c-type cytochrome [Pseudomonadota bacterium]
MRNRAIVAAGLISLTLAACGSKEPEPVVEQIVVREPGEPAANAVMEANAPAGGTDLVALGRSAFQTCTGCHNAEQGAPSMAGPNLYGVVGRKAGSLSDYAYSAALKGSEITWDFATLDRFLANPAGYVEGTSMVAGEVSDGQTRAAIVAYLASTSE